jgi:hypothetical protein
MEILVERETRTHDGIKCHVDRAHCYVEADTPKEAELLAIEQHEWEKGESTRYACTYSPTWDSVQYTCYDDQGDKAVPYHIREED